jgi:hypothetical protein
MQFDFPQEIPMSDVVQKFSDAVAARRIASRFAAEKMVPPPKNRKVIENISQWHSSQGDPIYAVGSSWFAGHDVPMNIVEDAYGSFETMHQQADQGKHGWGPKEVKEIEGILKAMKDSMRRAK